MHTRFPPIAAAMLGAAILTSCEPAPTEPVPAALAIVAANAPPVALEWHQAARNLVAANNMNPLVAGRVYAAVGMAQHGAIAAVGGTSAASSNPMGYGAGGRSLYEARRGAVAGASLRVLSFLVPSAATSLEQMLEAQNSGHPQFAFGVVIGRTAGDAMVQRLMNDRFTAPFTGTPLTGPGYWTTAAPPGGGASLGGALPYFLASATQFRPAPPPPYLSPAFNADLDEVLMITTVTATPAQMANAVHWAYGANTYTPLGFWNELAGTYAAEAGLDEAAAAQVMALVGAAMWDAFIACFEAKYFYWTLRPHQANPAIQLAYGVPNYPAYPSGHQSISSAAARVLTHFFPSHAGDLDALRAEASESRIIGGIHYRFDMDAARILGEGVADWVLAQGT
jgi:membrane-associated phospholipid phosphatase